MYVIIVGGGKVGFNLANTMLLEDYEVLLIEKDNQKCQKFDDMLGSITINGDGAEVSVLQQAGAGRAEVVIAATGGDEDNLIVCQIAKKRFGVSKTIARVNNPKNEALFQRLGVDATVSQTSVILSMIEQLIPERKFLHLMNLKQPEIAIVEVGVSADSPVVGKMLHEIQLPSDCVFSAITRGTELIIPTGNTMIHSGDQVVAVTRQESEAPLRQLLVNDL